VQPQANLVRVKIPAYSSVTAFLEHYRALKSVSSRSPGDEQLFIEMTAAIAKLPPDNQAALDATDDTASAKRHRERAIIQLRRELAARAIVAG
jgi:hypothetical protein